MFGRKINENLIITVNIDLKGFQYEYRFKLELDKEKSVGKVFKDFARLKNHNIGSNYYIYLSRNQNIVKELNKSDNIYQSELKTGDKVIITDTEKPIRKINFQMIMDETGSNKVEITNEVLYTTKITKRRSIKNSPKFRFTKKFWMVLIIISIFLLGIIGGLLYLFIFKKKKIIVPNPPINEKEDLIVNINYKTDTLYKYEYNKNYKMKFEQKNKEGYIIKDQLIFSDIFFILRNHFIEHNNTINTTKNLFSGYLGVFNMTFRNETNDLQVIYDKNLNKILNLNNFRHLKNKNLLYEENEKKNLCFVKINFYENGEILNISFPLKYFLYPIFII